MRKTQCATELCVVDDHESDTMHAVTMRRLRIQPSAMHGYSRRLYPKRYPVHLLKYRVSEN